MPDRDDAPAPQVPAQGQETPDELPPSTDLDATIAWAQRAFKYDPDEDPDYSHIGEEILTDDHLDD